MGTEKAIELIKLATSEVEWEYSMEYAAAFDEAIKALEKQIPKKMPLNGFGSGEIKCGCGSILDIYECTKLCTCNYCPVCGQALDFEGI